ncbi:hypothetical protein PanWU01x14_235930 [Parasponia andersonii]|uniref:Uncharacterized protein n=1 Tax=Parasponia andersonii TaxID=3476 RepID=A0A2P5BIL3_PARAD|nr:hypothetical protein PanWU01x14_235930 [Parasponia andersonii]
MLFLIFENIPKSGAERRSGWWLTTASGGENGGSYPRLRVTPSAPRQHDFWRWVIDRREADWPEFKFGDIVG